MRDAVASDSKQAAVRVFTIFLYNAIGATSEKSHAIERHGKINQWIEQIHRTAEITTLTLCFFSVLAEDFHFNSSMISSTHTFIHSDARVA